MVSAFNYMNQLYLILYTLHLLYQFRYYTSIILHYPPHYLALVALVESETDRADRVLRWAEDNGINMVDLSGTQQ